MRNDGAVPGRIREDLRRVSREVFGKQYRLEVAVTASAVEPPVWSRRLSQLLAIPENQVAAEILNFEAMGALQRFPAEHDRRKIYQAVAHPLWPFARDLFTQTIFSAEPEEGSALIARFWSTVLDGAQPKAVPG